MSSSKNINIVKLQVVKEGTIDYGVENITSSKELAEIGRKVIGNADREMFILVCLDNRHRINALHIVSIGTLTGSPVHPREVFKVAILSNAAAIAFIHNHPSSGDPKPSREDIALTENLVQCAQLLCIRVLDHVILGEDDSYVSFCDQALAGINAKEVRDGIYTRA
jgi:DNA repair protein RadC